MASLKCTRNDEVVIVTSTSILLSETEGFSRLPIPEVSKEELRENFNKELIKQIEHDDVCSDISPDGTLLAVCSKRKLTVWSLHGFRKLISSRQISRAASKIRFVPSGDNVIVSDKSGDVYQFSVRDHSSPGVLLLGHLSVILDVFVTLDEKYIISCDRDEKIRISHYPNAYSIFGFCLGHTEFVSCIELLPSNPSIFISGSGDGTIKFWKWIECKEVHSLSLKSMCPQLESPCPAVTSVEFLKEPSGGSDFLFVTVSGLLGVIFLRTSITSCIDISFVQYLPLTGIPVCLTTNLNNVYALVSSTDCFLQKFTFESSSGTFSDTSMVDTFKSEDFRKEILLGIENHGIKNVDHLFKKRYDNVQEYMDKKKARLELSK